jgi:tetratricopeptide (TPR) repeat protein
MGKWFNHSSVVVLWIGLGACAAAVPPSASPLERRLGTNPNDAGVNLELGAEAEAGGDLLRAEQYYLRAEALGVPAEKIVPRILRVLVAAQRYEEALARCKRRLAQAPEDRTTRFVEAALLVAVERPAEAEQELNGLMRTGPGDPEVYLALGKLYRDAFADRQRARGMFEKYLELAPRGAEAAAIRYELGERPSPPGPSLPPASASSGERPSPPGSSLPPTSASSGERPSPPGPSLPPTPEERR